MTQKYPFPVDPELTTIAMAYRNRLMVADSVLPIVPVGKREFKYTEFTKEDRFTVPETQVGRKSRPNQVEFGASEATASVTDYGLDDPIPQDDIDNAAPRFNPITQAVESIQDLLALGREIRTANLVMNDSNYSLKNAVDLAWSDSSADVIGDIHAAQDAVLMPVNIMTMSKKDWRLLSTHPQIVKAIHRNSGDTGIVTRQQVAELLELEEIIVGEAMVNTAKKGQTASFARAWGSGKVALHHRADNIKATGSITFGFTAEYGERVSGQWEDKNIGLRGGQMVRSGLSVAELIVAADCGYMLTGVSS